MASISESVREELVYICATRTKALYQGVRDRIDDLERYRDKRTQEGLSEGERRAVDEGASLQISWAVTPRGRATDYQKALIQAYEGKYGSKPCYKSKVNECIPGNVKGGNPNLPIGDLDWSPWYPAVAKTKPHLLQGDEHGVFRIKAPPLANGVASMLKNP